MIMTVQLERLMAEDDWEEWPASILLASDGSTTQKECLMKCV
jgi:hypothetical protein